MGLRYLIRHIFNNEFFRFYEKYLVFCAKFVDFNLF